MPERRADMKGRAAWLTSVVNLYAAKENLAQPTFICPPRQSQIDYWHLLSLEQHTGRDWRSVSYSLRRCIVDAFAVAPIVFGTFIYLVIGNLFYLDYIIVRVCNHAKVSQVIQQWVSDNTKDAFRELKLALWNHFLLCLKASMCQIAKKKFCQNFSLDIFKTNVN